MGFLYRRGETALVVNMFLDFQHAADQIAASIQASIGMGMQNDLFFPADQFLLNLIAIVRMGVSGRLFLPANELLRITLHSMGMAFCCLFTCKISLCVITASVLRTNQRSPRFVAFHCMSMACF